MIGYPLAEATNLWMADNRLTNYRIQVTTKEITRNPAIANVGDTFVAPLQLFPTLLVHVRRPKGSAGAVVAGVPLDNPRKPLWETQVGVPDQPLGRRSAAATDQGPDRRCRRSMPSGTRR